MASVGKPSDGVITLAEMREFASFPAATQRYIRRSLDVAMHRRDPMETWSRDLIEEASIRAQARIYGRLDEVKAMVPDDSGLDQVEPFMAPLVVISAFDLSQNRLNSFQAYRFLYERLIGAGSRPWLPGAFCAAASLPHLHPEMRRSLLQSISEAAATRAGLVEPRTLLLPRVGGKSGYEQSGELILPCSCESRSPG